MTDVSMEMTYVRANGTLTYEGMALFQDILDGIGGGGGGGATDLGYTAATRILTSSTGADVTLPLATTLLPGLMSAADKTTIAGLSGQTVTGGATTINFGAAPGSSVASATIIGQAAILSGSRIRAWVQGSTASFNEYEHSRVLPLLVDFGISDIIAGTGFTIQAVTNERLTGSIAVKWEWA